MSRQSHESLPLGYDYLPALATPNTVLRSSIMLAASRSAARAVVTTSSHGLLNQGSSRTFSRAWEP